MSIIVFKLLRTFVRGGPWGRFCQARSQEFVKGVGGGLKKAYLSGLKASFPSVEGAKLVISYASLEYCVRLNTYIF